MKPRHRAQLRLARQVPTLTHPTDRHPVRRMARREDEVPEPRAVPGASVRIPEEVKIKPLRTARDVVHAPLLIRLVRNPFALSVGRARRVLHESRTRPSILDREPFPHATEEWAAIRESRRVARPMQELEHRPVYRAHPFQRARDQRLGEPEPIFFDPQAEEGWL